jgi:adenylosuccinate synthase
MPADTADITAAEPVYETMPGWKSSTEQAQDWSDLPEAAQNYLTRLSDLCGARISIISTGPARSQTFSN